MRSAIIVLAFLSFLIGQPLLAQQSSHKILAGKVLDIQTGTLLEDVLIEIDDGIISDITENFQGPAEDGIIDLSNLTVLPGLIDAHTHLCDNSFMGSDFDHWTYPAATFGIVGTVNAQKTLEAGFTTVRNVSEPFYADIALRDAINVGWVDGPRMYVSGAMITMSGGHGNWGNWIAPQHVVNTTADAVADGPDEVRKATRIHIKHGVDLIKITATGGFGTSNSIPGAASYTIEEIEAAVDEAQKRGLKVAAHAHGAEGIKNAIAGGVHSIEHAAFLDQESIELMKDRGVYLVMDLLAAHYELIEKNKDYSDKDLSSNNQAIFDDYLDRFRQAHTAGVNMAFGSDAGVYPHGRNAEQFRLMVDAGMTALDAIRAATHKAAELIGIEKQAGEIKTGKWADLIAVKGNPLEDISELERVQFVMKAGQIYKSDNQ